MEKENVRKRQLIAKKFGKYGPSTVYLQVLGSGARGVPNTLYLFTDQKRYLFNCGECTQRLAHEHKVKLSRLEDIFITSKTWANLGGLPGLSLTLQDVSVPNITIHGPDGLEELYKATSRFVKVKDMDINIAKCTPIEDFEDDVMSVKYVFLTSDNIFHTEPAPAAKKARLNRSSPDKQFQEFLNDDTDYNCDIRNQDGSKDKNTKLRITSADKDYKKKKTDKALSDFHKKSIRSVAYICTIRKRLGTLDLKKCLERGVKPGPLLGQLKSGQDVMLPDGTLVLSKDVKTPDDPGPVFIVLEVPDINCLRESEFAAHFDSASNPPENIPAVVVHFTPPHVFNNAKYREFMALFGPTTKHLVLNSQNSCLGSEAVHSTQHRLHLLDADIFPLLRDVSIPAVWTAPSAQPAQPIPNTISPTKLRGIEELKNKIASAQFQNIINADGADQGDVEVQSSDAGSQLQVIAGRTLTTYHLRPKNELDKSIEPKLHIQDYIQEVMNVDGFVNSLEQFRQLIEKMRYSNKASQQEYPKVIFLGTGSCIPSKTRNTSAIVLQIDESRSMLLDCGEGTFGQLVRFFGPKRVNSFLMTLKAVYVSHLHADHHLGLIGVLQGRREAFQELKLEATPLQLLAPGQIFWWLSMYDQEFQRIREDFTLVPNQNLLESSPDFEQYSPVLAGMGVQRVVTCRVEHCPNAFGVALQLGEHKITYSGDTVPCEELVNIGRNSTLLIHEATLEDDLAEEATLKMHSTTSQAIEMGRRMGAHYTLLTHFSQRYARLPRLGHHMLSENQSVGIAFDNMQISMSDLEILPHMYAPLQFMFAEHCVELELKAEHRARQKEKAAIVPTSVEPNAKKKKQPHLSCKSAPPLRSRLPITYRESNASRLRHELKNRTSHAVKPTRSKSWTPHREPAHRTKYKASDSLPCSPQRPSFVDKSAMGSQQQITGKCNTKSRQTSNVSYVNIINARSKDRDAKRTASINKHTARIQNNANIPSTKEPGAEETGYGKPLLAPLDRKLTIRRDVRPMTKLEKSQTSSARPRSPIKSWKAENSVSPVTSSRTNTMCKIPVTNCRTKGRDCANMLIAGSEMKTETAKQNPVTKRIRSAQHNAPSHRDSIERKMRDSSPSGAGSRSVIPTTKNNITKINDVTEEHTTLPIYRNETLPIYCRDKYNPPNTKTFKPQLEDIKSSYMLLNQKNMEKNVKSSPEKASKPQRPLSVHEIERRSKLKESKQKYNTKQFWNEAKFKNIEGLNWISWK